MVNRGITGFASFTSTNIIMSLLRKDSPSITREISRIVHNPVGYLDMMRRQSASTIGRDSWVGLTRVWSREEGDPQVIEMLLDSGIIRLAFQAILDTPGHESFTVNDHDVNHPAQIRLTNILISEWNLDSGMGSTVTNPMFLHYFPIRGGRVEGEQVVD